MAVRQRSALDDFEKPRRLAELGLKESELRRAIEAGMVEASACTAHNPANYPGMVIWGASTRELRDILVPQKWTPEDVSGLPTVRHPMGTHQIAVASGTSDTGRADAIPRTRHPRGRVTELAVEFNQLTLGDLSVGFDTFEPSRDPRSFEQTWYLLHYRDATADEVRMELSLPGHMAQGNITGWIERIILDPLPGVGDAPFDDGTDGGPEFDIPVTPRR